MQCLLPNLHYRPLMYMLTFQPKCYTESCHASHANLGYLQPLNHVYPRHPGPSIETETCFSLLRDRWRHGHRRGTQHNGLQCLEPRNLLPGPFVACCQARMLSEGGRCKTFDATADGYSRGEGAGTVLVRRLSDLGEEAALPAVNGTAANQDGRSSSLTAPNGPAQQEVIQTAWAEAGLAPSAADFIETHGTGTGLGDPIEIGSLCNTMGQNRSTAS